MLYPCFSIRRPCSSRLRTASRASPCAIMQRKVHNELLAGSNVSGWLMWPMMASMAQSCASSSVNPSTARIRWPMTGPSASRKRSSEAVRLPWMSRPWISLRRSPSFDIGRLFRPSRRSDANCRDLEIFGVQIDADHWGSAIERDLCRGARSDIRSEHDPVAATAASKTAFDQPLGERSSVSVLFLRLARRYCPNVLFPLQALAVEVVLSRPRHDEHGFGRAPRSIQRTGFGQPFRFVPAHSRPDDPTVGLQGQCNRSEERSEERRV